MSVKLSCKAYINGLVQDCSNSIANTLELLRYCTTQHSHNIIQYVTTLAAAASVFWCCFATWEINTKMTLLWVHKQFATWVHNQSMFYQVKIYMSRNKMWKVWTYTRKYRNVSKKNPHVALCVSSVNWLEEVYLNLILQCTKVWDFRMAILRPCIQPYHWAPDSSPIQLPCIWTTQSLSQVGGWKGKVSRVTGRLLWTLVVNNEKAASSCWVRIFKTS